VWIEVLTGSGFEASDRWEETTEDRPARQIFIGHRPAT
jgi:hypothetical protein